MGTWKQDRIDLCNPMFLRPMGKGQARTRRWVKQSNIKKKYKIPGGE